MSVSKKKYLQSFKNSYSGEFPCVANSRKSQYHAFCMECSADFSIAHSGRGDIVAHVGSKKHAENVAKNNRSENKITNFFENSSNQNDVIRAECLITAFLVEHNLPLSCADHVGPLLRKIFPTSEVAKRYGCARTKTSAIVGEFAEEATSKLVETLKTQSFSIATDGSNDYDSKLYPIVVTYFCEERKEIVSNVLATPSLEGDATGLNIGNLLLENLKRRNIPVRNCIGLVTDNAPVMIGRKTGVAAVLRKHQENLTIVGCPCHLLHLAAEKGALALPINADELLVDIFYYLQKSSKRKEKLRTFQELHSADTKKILKHVCTRWLSLGKCIVRLLAQWNALARFFREEISKGKKSTNLDTYTIPRKIEQCESTKTDLKNRKKAGVSKKRSAEEAGFVKQPVKAQQTSNVSASSVLSREERLFYELSSDANKGYCLFLAYIIPCFDRVNCQLQSASPLIHKVRLILLNFFREILSKFVKPSLVNEEENCLTVKYHSRMNQKDDADLLIGRETSALVNTLNGEEKRAFFTNIREYYVKVSDYMVHKFPFAHETLLKAEVCNCDHIQNASFTSVEFFISKFPIILRACSCTIDDLQSEFCKLQMMKLPSVIVAEEKPDAQWVAIGELQNELGEYPYKNIARVMLAILSIPHSNAECERLFSQVKKIRTEFRSSMSNENLQHFLVMKCNLKGKCYEQQFSDSFLRKAKSSTYTKNSK